jgi:hypothetical protein
MRPNSRSSIRWGVATAVVALALSALAITGKAALADGGGNGRLMAANQRTLSDDAVSEEKVQPAPDLVDDAEATGLGDPDDGNRIGDDSDVASVDGSVNDGDADGDFFDETF